MSDDAMDAEDSLPEGYGDVDREAMLAALHALPSRWKAASRPLGLSPKDWLPTLRSGKNEALHLHLVPELGKPWIERMALAKAAGYQISVAAPEELWRVPKTMVEVDRVDALPIVLRCKADSKWAAYPHESVARMIVGAKVFVDPATRSALGLRALERALAATASVPKGRLFEAFLAFLFSQVNYLELFSSNYANDTEEIDLVLRNRQSSAGALPRAPLILVSAKNKKEPVGAPALTSLDAKIRNRRGQCGFGILCCSRKFAGTVSEHLLRSSREPHVIALLDGEGLRTLVGAEDLEEAIEAIATQASLS